MNEPYLLWVNRHRVRTFIPGKRKTDQKGDLKKGHEEKQKERETRSKSTTAPNEAAMAPFLTSQELMLKSVITLQFVRWIAWTRWVIHF